MSLTVTERYRTVVKPIRVDPQPQPLRVGPILPMRLIHQRQKARLEAEQKELIARQRAEMERDGNGTERLSQFDVTHRRVDAPYQAQGVVMPKDAREAKYGKALLYADMQPGKVPLIVMGNGAEYWQALKEMADEARHYKEDRIEHPRTRHVSYEEIWRTGVERHRRKLAGKRTYGAATRGQMTRVW